MLGSGWHNCFLLPAIKGDLHSWPFSNRSHKCILGSQSFFLLLHALGTRLRWSRKVHFAPHRFPHARQTAIMQLALSITFHHRWPVLPNSSWVGFGFSGQHFLVTKCPPFPLSPPLWQQLLGGKMNHAKGEEEKFPFLLRVCTTERFELMHGRPLHTNSDFFCCCCLSLTMYQKIIVNRKIFHVVSLHEKKFCC